MLDLQSVGLGVGVLLVHLLHLHLHLLHLSHLLLLLVHLAHVHAELLRRLLGLGLLVIASHDIAKGITLGLLLLWLGRRSLEAHWFESIISWLFDWLVEAHV